MGGRVGHAVAVVFDDDPFDVRPAQIETKMAARLGGRLGARLGVRLLGGHGSR